MKCIFHHKHIYYYYSSSSSSSLLKEEAGNTREATLSGNPDSAGAILTRLTCDPWGPSPSGACSSSLLGWHENQSCIGSLGLMWVKPQCCHDQLQDAAQISKISWPSQDITLLLEAVPAVCQFQVHRAHCVILQERHSLNHSLAEPHTVPWT